MRRNPSTGPVQTALIWIKRQRTGLRTTLDHSSGSPDDLIRIKSLPPAQQAASSLVSAIRERKENRHRQRGLHAYPVASPCRFQLYRFRWSFPPGRPAFPQVSPHQRAGAIRINHCVWEKRSWKPTIDSSSPGKPVKARAGRLWPRIPRSHGGHGGLRLWR